ncbi:sensor histidine kinase [Rhodococcus koreensis]|uniref:sensor histidine kinase n=1 Tax=Rhodococcus koreensis TaxID=99653 RepID=UPI00366EA26E
MDAMRKAQSVWAELATLQPTPDVLWAHPAAGLALRVFGHLRRADQRRPWILDTSVVALAAAAAPPDLLADDAAGSGSTRWVGAGLPIAVVLAVAAVLVVPLWWRRRAPTTAFVASVPSCLVLWSLGLGPTAAFVVFIALFNLSLHGRPRRIFWALLLTVVGWVLVVVFLYPVNGPAGFLVMSIGTGVGAVALGLTFRLRRLYLSALHDRAVQLEIERDQRVQLTAATERSRVAREMHDIVGHNLTIMVNLADGAAVLVTQDPARTARALELIGDTGRQAMRELRRVLDVLRESSEQDMPLSPPPGLHDLDTLIDRVRSAGVPVTYRTAGPVDELDSGLQLATFRIVQEALTNTLKHAGTGASADVLIGIDDGRLQVRVTDTGSPGEETPSTVPRQNDSGHGLVGIRHRAALYDGTVVTGPREDGPGWIVEVRVDLTAPTTSGKLAP